MSNRAQKKLLRHLLLKKSGRSRLWLAWSSLCIGTVLLLLAVVIWWNFQELLYDKKDSDSLGSTFLTVSKKVTNENMGHSDLTVFSQQDIDALQKTAGVQAVGTLTSNRFPAYITLNSRLGFSSDIFLESVPDQFIDKKPDEWYWQENNRSIPIILSGEFLNLYNYGFALSQGLPQLSESSIQSLSFDLIVGTPDIRETYSAHVVGFSDRITSVLVPQAFMDFANGHYGKGFHPKPSRLIVKVADPSDKRFVQYLEKNNYTTNSEQLRWSRLRTIVEVVAGSTGVLALLLMGISMLVFVLFIELTIARARQSMELLMQIGYHPRFLNRFMTLRFLPLMLTAILIACTVVILVQYGISLTIVQYKLQLPKLPGWPIWAVACVCVLLLAAQIRFSISRAVSRI